MLTLKNKLGYLILFLIVFIVFFDFFVGNKIFVPHYSTNNDATSIYYPMYLEHISNFKSGRLFETWSNYMGIGQSNILGINNKVSLTDPFNIIIILLGKNLLPYTLGYINAIKFLVGGILFYVYLNKRYKNNSVLNLAGAIVYMSLGPFVARSVWYHYTTEIVFIPIFLMSLDSLIKAKRINLWITFCYFCISIYQPIYLWIYSIFAIFYIFHNIFTKYLDYIYLKRLIKTYIISSFFGVMLGMFILLPTLINQLSSNRLEKTSNIFQSFSQNQLDIKVEDNLKVTLARFFNTDILGAPNEFKGYGHRYHDSPYYYVSITILFFFILILALNYKNKSILRYYIIPLSITLLILFPVTRYIFNAFSGDYYKLNSFFIPLFILLSFINILSQEKNQLFNINTKKTIIYSVITYLSLLGLLIFSTQQYLYNINFLYKYVILILSTNLIFIIFALLFKKINFNVFSNYLLTILIIETIFTMYYNFNQINQYTQYNNSNSTRIDYYDESFLNLFNEKISIYDDNEMYRIAKQPQSAKYNDAMVWRYYSPSFYSSFPNINQINFIKSSTSADNLSHDVWYGYLPLSPILNDLYGIKYIIAHQDELVSIPRGNVDKLSEYDKWILYENKNYNGLGFIYDKYIVKDKKITSKSNVDMEKLLINHAITNSNPNCNGLTKVNSNEYNSYLNNFDYDKASMNLRSNGELILLNLDNQQSKFAGQVNSNLNGILVISLPYDKRWQIKVNDIIQNSFIVNNGFLGICINEGDSEISIKYINKDYRYGILISLTTLFTMLYIYRIHEVFLNRLFKWTKKA